MVNRSHFVREAHDLRGGAVPVLSEKLVRRGNVANQVSEESGNESGSLLNLDVPMLMGRTIAARHEPLSEARLS
jgi:hypothetical protein